MFDGPVSVIRYFVNFLLVRQTLAVENLVNLDRGLCLNLLENGRNYNKKEGHKDQGAMLNEDKYNTIQL